jgi:hypothetical protein
MASPFDRHAAGREPGAAYFAPLAVAVVQQAEAAGQTAVAEPLAGGCSGRAGWRYVGRNWLHWG